MKLLQLVALLTLNALPVFAAEQATETASTELDGARLEFQARKIETPDRKLAYGYAVFEGQLYWAIGNPPSRVMTAGKIRIGEQEIALDVSGLGDPWVEAKLDKRFVQFKRKDFPSGPIYELLVCFEKGGAEDYMVEWVIKDGKSLRLAITSLGDTLPEWVMPPK
ncbi:hypothetical protein [Haloferula sp. BvORR071]|uniref:hypothetical protein n=1 Tax=Haloferula sp. BvORR071 TaxID=1396141 RepID=UPI0005545A0C|nr:hypothetical protein [Haloferula sp. BvORR071]